MSVHSDQSNNQSNNYVCVRFALTDRLRLCDEKWHYEIKEKCHCKIKTNLSWLCIFLGFIPLNDFFFIFNTSGLQSSGPLTQNGARTKT